jgi:transposase InsO family protein
MLEQGRKPVQAVMSDNHEAYTSHHFQTLLAELGARHITTPPHTPRWNGKAERLHRTLNDEWARSQTTSLGDRPPISRVHQERRQDN